ncbi:regulatory protein RecX [Microbacterium sp. CPCC 204701]|uniref:regulatory protein RecX n=1 Tax=Microbacterium sp. CPCC 204701 TaxID=2493084 RepID=UPI000FDBBCF0|nr:regulatory protein RecX [Microbacterium sp. CPCC 204701]
MVRFSDTGGDGGEQHDSLAPVIPLFGAQSGEQRRLHPGTSTTGTVAWNATSADDPEGDDGLDDGSVGRPRDGAGGGIGHESAEDLRNRAEKSLLKKLRTRSLSVLEARAVVAELSLDPETVEVLLQAFLDRGYLDDAALAEQLVHAGVDRKGQGRRVIAQTLAKRGVPRDVAEAALAALPDDDADRALEYARSKAGAMRDLDRDAALRRLSGQLARRGYGGSVAFDAARRALDEQGSVSRVRFR